MVATDPEESFLDDVHLRGDDARVGDRPGGWDMLTTDPEESLLGDVHVRGGRRSCRRPTRGSDVVATDVLPSDLGSSFGARKPKTSFA